MRDPFSSYKQEAKGHQAIWVAVLAVVVVPVLIFALAFWVFTPGPETKSPPANDQVTRPIERAPIADIAPAPPPPASLLESQIRVDIIRSNRYVWPAFGPVSSFFGPGHADGIDIALDYTTQSPIRSMAEGIVDFAGGDPCCGYGLYIEVLHLDGSRSLYAHLSEVLVRQNARVQQGELIGLGGATGSAEGKHLHLELRVDELLVDPLRYLATTQPDRQVLQGVRCSDQTIEVDPASQVSLRFVTDPPVTHRYGEMNLIALTFGQGLATPEILGHDGQRVVFRTEPATVAAGGTSFFRVEVELQSNDASTIVPCQFRLATMATLTNPEDTAARLRAARVAAGIAADEPPVPSGPPPPTLTPTATPRPPVPRATPAPTFSPPAPPAAPTFSPPAPMSPPAPPVAPTKPGPPQPPAPPPPIGGPPTGLR